MFIVWRVRKNIKTRHRKRRLVLNLRHGALFLCFVPRPPPPKNKIKPIKKKPEQIRTKTRSNRPFGRRLPGRGLRTSNGWVWSRSTSGKRCTRITLSPTIFGRGTQPRLELSFLRFMVLFSLERELLVLGRGYDPPARRAKRSVFIRAILRANAFFRNYTLKEDNSCLICVKTLARSQTTR